MYASYICLINFAFAFVSNSKQFPCLTVYFSQCLRFQNRFTKAIGHFVCVYIASSKHQEGWEFETVKQTLSYVLGLHNFQEFSVLRITRHHVFLHVYSNTFLASIHEISWKFSVPPSYGLDEATYAKYGKSALFLL